MPISVGQENDDVLGLPCRGTAAPSVADPKVEVAAPAARASALRSFEEMPDE